MTKLHSVTDDVPAALRPTPIETVAIHVDATVPFVIFAEAIARAGLVIRGDGRGGMVIAREGEK